MGRPKLEINSDSVYECAKIGCTNTEIADIFGCGESTIRARFQAELSEARAEMCKSLRKKQLEVAASGNPTMLIWLGKQYLGQHEPEATKITETKEPILVKVNFEDVNGDAGTNVKAEPEAAAVPKS